MYAHYEWSRFKANTANLLLIILFLKTSVHAVPTLHRYNELLIASCYFELVLTNKAFPDMQIMNYCLKSVFLIPKSILLTYTSLTFKRFENNFKTIRIDTI